MALQDALVILKLHFPAVLRWSVRHLLGVVLRGGHVYLGKLNRIKFAVILLRVLA